MYRKCATDISVQHQKQVTQSLQELMLKMPYEDITVTQLCQAAGISRRIFYHLFTNKTGALHALVDHKILDSESYGGEIQDTLVRFFCYWREQQDFLDALAKNNMSGLLLEQMINCVMTEDYDVRYWLKEKGWAGNSQEVVIFGLSGLVGLVYSWYYGGFRQEPEELAALVGQMMPTN